MKTIEKSNKIMSGSFEDMGIFHIFQLSFDRGRGVIYIRNIFDISSGDTWDWFRSNMGGTKYYNKLKWLQLEIL